MGTLYLVATPIGNLEDITLRALRILNEVALVCAEDTRTTRRLLRITRFNTSCSATTSTAWRRAPPRSSRRWSQATWPSSPTPGRPASATPATNSSSPRKRPAFTVVPIPGPQLSSPLSQHLASQPRVHVSSASSPAAPANAAASSSRWLADPRTLVFFESPNRLRRSLEDMQTALGDRRLAVCRELTKMFEEIFRGRISEALDHFTEPRGEFTLVVEGQTISETEPDEATIDRLLELKRSGTKAREAVRRVATETGKPHREVYRLWLDLDVDSPDH